MLEADVNNINKIEMRNKLHLIINNKLNKSYPKNGV